MNKIGLVKVCYRCSLWLLFAVSLFFCSAYGQWEFANKSFWLGLLYDDDLWVSLSPLATQRDVLCEPLLREEVGDVWLDYDLKLKQLVEKEFPSWLETDFSDGESLWMRVWIHPTYVEDGDYVFLQLKLERDLYTSGVSSHWDAFRARLEKKINADVSFEDLKRSVWWFWMGRLFRKIYALEENSSVSIFRQTSWQEFVAEKMVSYYEAVGSQRLVGGVFVDDSYSDLMFKLYRRRLSNHNRQERWVIARKALEELVFPYLKEPIDVAGTMFMELILSVDGRQLSQMPSLRGIGKDLLTIVDRYKKRWGEDCIERGLIEIARNDRWLQWVLELFKQSPVWSVSEKEVQKWVYFLVRLVFGVVSDRFSLEGQSLIVSLDSFLQDKFASKQQAGERERILSVYLHDVRLELDEQILFLGRESDFENAGTMGLSRFPPVFVNRKGFLWGMSLASYFVTYRNNEGVWTEVVRAVGGSEGSWLGFCVGMVDLVGETATVSILKKISRKTVGDNWQKRLTRVLEEIDDSWVFHNMLGKYIPLICKNVAKLMGFMDRKTVKTVVCSFWERGDVRILSEIVYFLGASNLVSLNFLEEMVNLDVDILRFKRRSILKDRERRRDLLRFLLSSKDISLDLRLFIFECWAANATQLNRAAEYVGGNLFPFVIYDFAKEIYQKLSSMDNISLNEWIRKSPSRMEVVFSLLEASTNYVGVSSSWITKIIGFYDKCCSLVLDIPRLRIRASVLSWLLSEKASWLTIFLKQRDWFLWKDVFPKESIFKEVITNILGDMEEKELQITSARTVEDIRVFLLEDRFAMHTAVQDIVLAMVFLSEENGFLLEGESTTRRLALFSRRKKKIGLELADAIYQVDFEFGSTLPLLFTLGHEVGHVVLETAGFGGGGEEKSCFKELFADAMGIWFCVSFGDDAEVKKLRESFASIDYSSPIVIGAQETYYLVNRHLLSDLLEKHFEDSFWRGFLNCLLEDIQVYNWQLSVEDQGKETSRINLKGIYKKIFGVEMQIVSKEKALKQEPYTHGRELIFSTRKKDGLLSAFEMCLYIAGEQVPGLFESYEKKMVPFECGTVKVIAVKEMADSLKLFLEKGNVSDSIGIVSKTGDILYGEKKKTGKIFCIDVKKADILFLRNGMLDRDMEIVLDLLFAKGGKILAAVKVEDGFLLVAGKSLNGVLRENALEQIEEIVEGFGLDSSQICQEDLVLAAGFLGWQAQAVQVFREFSKLCDLGLLDASKRMHRVKQIVMDFRNQMQSRFSRPGGLFLDYIQKR